MNANKNIIIGFLTFMLLSTSFLTSWGGNDMQQKIILNKFSKLIETEDFDDFRLTIYYVSPYLLTRIPYSNLIY